MPAGLKLRAPKPALPFHVALLEPEIPQNTGAVARTCVATCSPLHLIGRLGFELSERAVRRAGLDYWQHLRLEQHPDLDSFTASRPDSRVHCFSAGATRSYLDATFHPGDVLLFGKESVGLPQEVLDAHHDRCWGIPTLGPVRSLNLSNAVAVVVYEALRQRGLLLNPELQP